MAGKMGEKKKTEQHSFHVVATLAFNKPKKFHQNEPKPESRNQTIDLRNLVVVR